MQVKTSCVKVFLRIAWSLLRVKDLIFIRPTNLDEQLSSGIYYPIESYIQDIQDTIIVMLQVINGEYMYHHRLFKGVGPLLIISVFEILIKMLHDNSTFKIPIENADIKIQIILKILFD